LNFGYVLVPLLVGASVVLGVTPVLIRLARHYGLYDFADERKVHPVGISRLGGVGMLLGIAIAGSAAMLWGKHSFSGHFVFGLGVGVAPIFVVSLWDDLRNLPWWIRFLVQLLGAVLFAYVMHPLERMHFPFIGTFQLGFWSYPIVVGWLLLTTNAMNFIDGLDGLAAGIAAIAGSVLLISAFRAGFIPPAALAAALVGVCIGFLPYNFPPARIFMGDSGSTLLGFVLGSISLVGAGKNVAFVSLLVPILALGVPLLDALGAITRRSYRGNSIFVADRKHVHHFLLSLGLGYRRTVVLLYIVSVLLGGIALFLATGPRISAAFIAVLVMVCFVLLFGKRRGKS